MQCNIYLLFYYNNETKYIYKKHIYKIVQL